MYCVINRRVLVLLCDSWFVCFQPVPYSNMIPGGMFPKRTVIIRGMVPYGADRCVCVCV